MPDQRTDRRRFIKQIAAATAACGLASSAEAAPDPPDSNPDPAPGPAKLTTYTFGCRLWIRINERVFTCYRSESSQKYPYFYPVLGPVTGLPMTDETGLPWPHHRSLFLGCDHVNAGNFWQGELEQGQIISKGAQAEESDADRAVFTDTCEWSRPGQRPILSDARRFTVTQDDEQRRFIDADITLTAVTGIHIAKTNHSFFSLRAAHALTPSGGGQLVNAHDLRGEKATFGQPAPWCGYHGTRLGHTESIILMDHPGNPWSPCPWFTRDYGFISPTPFFWLDDNGYRLPAGQSVRVRYRVCAIPGPIETPAVNRIYEKWSANA